VRAGLHRRNNERTNKKFHRRNVKLVEVDSDFLVRVAREPQRPDRVCYAGHRNDAHHPTGQHMTQNLPSFHRPSRRATHSLIFAGALVASALFSGAANAQVLGYASAPQSFPSDNVMVNPDQSALSGGSASVLPERLRRAIVNINTREAPGTVIIDTGNTALYYVLGQGRAIRYGVGVGREGFTWAGTQTISRKAEWPDWHPPAEMIARQPYLPRFMAGGPGNPLGARAMYLGSSEYRIHGTNDPTTIGKFVSSGCIRLTNDDVADLFSRVDVGTRVVVLPKNGQHIEARAAVQVRASATPVRPAALSPGREAMNTSASSIH
jgi:lipoprotein-anchoring transpeptidase ErfK/SrfK